MGPANVPDEGRGEAAVSFAHALAELKERGSTLLVVGTVPEEMYATASRQMLGDPDAERSRRRVVVAPHADREGAVERLRSTGPIEPEYARLIACGDAARGTSAASPPEAGSVPAPDSPALPKEHLVGDSLSDLGVAISDTIEQFDAAARGLEPAELRLAFDCLPTLLSRHDTESVFRFLHILSTEIRSVDGIAHVRLPRERSAETVRTLMPLFDAVVELAIDDTLKQRWDFRDRQLVSDWLPVE